MRTALIAVGVLIAFGNAALFAVNVAAGNVLLAFINGVCCFAVLLIVFVQMRRTGR